MPNIIWNLRGKGVMAGRATPPASTATGSSLLPSSWSVTSTVFTRLQTLLRSVKSVNCRLKQIKFFYST